MKDSGTLFIYELKNIADPGDMPAEALDKVTSKHWFETMYIGRDRQSQAKGYGERIDLRVRIHYEPEARIDRFVVLGNGDQFRIIDCTPNKNEDGLRCTDMSLMRLEDFYDVADET